MVTLKAMAIFCLIMSTIRSLAEGIIVSDCVSIYNRMVYILGCSILLFFKIF